MFIEVDELKSVAYGYQLNEITEITADDDSGRDIILMAIDAAIEEMKSYLRRTAKGLPRYDVDAIFSTEGTARNALVLELCKSIALWYICRLSNVDIIEEKVTKRYDRAIDWLEKVSGTGKYAESPVIDPGLPVVTLDSEAGESLPFRFGSREKFNHE